VAVRVATVALPTAAVLGAPAWIGADTEVPDELLGSGGSLLWLPPRAVAVCASDDVCAVGLFGTLAEGARPDVVVVPAQQLWEPRVRARVAACLAEGDPAPGDRPASRAERAALAQRTVDALGAPDLPCPVLWEGGAVTRPTGVPLVAVGHGPWLSRGPGSASAAQRTLEGLVDAYRARVTSFPVRSADGRGAWSRAFESVGRGALEARASWVALRAMVRAVEAAPERAAAWSNLAVARSELGDVAGALSAAERAVELDPGRPTPWVNLVRFLLASGDREGAARALVRARGAGVDDARLEALAEGL